MSQRDASDRPMPVGAAMSQSDQRELESEPADLVVDERTQASPSSLQQAAARASAARQQATQALGSAASSLRQQAVSLPGGQPVQQAAQTVAGTLQSASQQLQEQDLSGVLQALERRVRDQPLAAVGLALLAGFVLGRLSD